MTKNEQNLFFLLLAFLIYYLFSYEPNESDKSVYITIKWGTIKGAYKEINGRKVAKFIGIPYAEPPINELRFAKPRPLQKVNQGIFDATKQLIHCINMPNIEFNGHDNPQFLEGENCLNLNIWTPANSLKHQTLKPVLIYIHGGGFLLDEHRLPMLEPDLLSSYGDIVVVTIKYRMGIFGCLFADRKDVPGNVALDDQALAIEWVYDNIKYFGGDEKQITLSGLSAGSVSVALHFLNKDVNRLFKRVIMRSGAVTTNLEESVDIAKKRFKTIAEEVSCWSDKDMDQTVDCLRRANVDDLTMAYMMSSKSLNLPTNFPYCIVRKGIYSQTDSDTRLNEGNVPQNMEILITTMQDEGSIILGTLKFDLTTDVITNFRNLASGMIPTIIDGDVDDLISLYFGGIISNGIYDSYKAMVDLLTDRYFVCPSIWFAEKTMDQNTVYTGKYVQMSKTFEQLEPKLIFDQTFGPRHAADMVYCK